MGLIKPPKPDPALEVFDEGVGVLSRNGEIAGHVATIRSWFWSPFSPLRRQWWVWYIVVWADGSRERSTEDYPPWSAVKEMQDGYLEWISTDAHRGRYDFHWLDGHAAGLVRERLKISAEDF